jgi:hypothetical protein
LNNRNRVRDKKRKVYNEFLNYIQNNDLSNSNILLACQFIENISNDYIKVKEDNLHALLEKQFGKKFVEGTDEDFANYTAESKTIKTYFKLNWLENNTLKQ